MYTILEKRFTTELLHPNPGTPLEAVSPIERGGYAIAGVHLPFSELHWVYVAMGRFSEGGEALLFAGGNADTAGDMLATTGTGVADGWAMAVEMGWQLG